MRTSSDGRRVGLPVVECSIQCSRMKDFGPSLHFDPNCSQASWRRNWAQGRGSGKNPKGSSSTKLGLSAQEGLSCIRVAEAGPFHIVLICLGRTGQTEERNSSPAKLRSSAQEGLPCMRVAEAGPFYIVSIRLGRTGQTEERMNSARCWSLPYGHGRRQQGLKAKPVAFHGSLSNLENCA